MTFRATLLTSLVLLPLACGSTQKPPPPDEVPIGSPGAGVGGTKTGGGDDPGSSGGGSGGNGGGTGTAGTAAVPDKPPPPGVGPQPMGGGDTPQPDAGGPAPAGSTVKKGPLTPKECSDVVNKFVTMMAKENHMPVPSLDGQTGQLGDVFSGMRNECAQNTTKKQYTCAMAARTTDVWKKCMQ
jgi:hypothetical protein